MSDWFEEIAKECRAEIKARPEWMKQKVQTSCPCCGVTQLVPPSIATKWEQQNDNR